MNGEASILMQGDNVVGFPVPGGTLGACRARVLLAVCHTLHPPREGGVPCLPGSPIDAAQGNVGKGFCHAVGGPGLPRKIGKGGNKLMWHWAATHK